MLRWKAFIAMTSYKFSFPLQVTAKHYNCHPKQKQMCQLCEHSNKTKIFQFQTKTRLLKDKINENTAFCFEKLCESSLSRDTFVNFLFQLSPNHLFPFFFGGWSKKQWIQYALAAGSVGVLWGEGLSSQFLQPLEIFLVPVVPKVDNTIHWINFYPLRSTIILVSPILIHWIVIYPVDDAIQCKLNNQSLICCPSQDGMFNVRVVLW